MAQTALFAITFTLLVAAALIAVTSALPSIPLSIPCYVCNSGDDPNTCGQSDFVANVSATNVNCTCCTKSTVGGTVYRACEKGSLTVTDAPTGCLPIPGRNYVCISALCNSVSAFSYQVIVTIAIVVIGTIPNITPFTSSFCVWARVLVFVCARVLRACVGYIAMILVYCRIWCLRSQSCRLQLQFHSNETCCCKI
jgi:hypothetical protein